uniref:dynein light chain Tctex-type 1 isoform X3 n=1 Tax=Monopterus albus TaxID=43700 RepID=UPI0009B43973|nr:dynein light chain Tctex-type 1 isoform X3 [Monopterus albus]
MDDYQTEEEESAFVVEEVSKIIKESVEATIGRNTYQHNRVNQWSTSVVEQCLGQLGKLGKPFKYIEKWSRSANSQCMLLGQLY